MDDRAQSKNQEPALKDLLNEAESVFNKLDSLSNKIREFEKKLATQKAFFPFRKFLMEEEPSLIKSLEPRHQVYSISHKALGYCTKICWYLAWQEDTHLNKFRLVLISEEIEAILYETSPKNITYDEISSRPLSKKPLIETDLATRFKFSEYVDPFIDEFKEFLKQHRVALEHK